MTERELLTAGLRELGVAECPSAADNLLRYSEILREKNKVMNLTAITDPTEIVTRHFLDCAALAPYMPQDGRVLDVGTGAGFPGMPLAILCPQTEFVLLDALRKRIDFLNEVIAELGLTNVTAVHARAEDYARDNRGTFDLAVSRAVADLRVLSELALPMVKVGGAFLAMKAEDCTEEVETAANARTVLGAPDAEVLHYTVPFDEVSRAIVCLQKTQETPEKYPRRFKTDFAAVNQARNIRKVPLCTENYRGYFLSENRGKYRYQVEFVMFSSNFADCAVDFTCQYVIIW